MLPLRTVDGDADAQVRVVLLYELLHPFRVVVDAVRGEGEAVGVKPVVIPPEHLRLQIVANLVYQLYLQERLTTDECSAAGNEKSIRLR